MKKFSFAFFLILLFGVLFSQATAFGQEAPETYLTGEQCAAQGGLPENGGYCSNSAVNKNVGKMVGFWGRVCCVNSTLNNLASLTKSACEAQGGKCIVPDASLEGLACPATRNTLGRCSDDFAKSAVCCGAAGSNTGTSAGGVIETVNRSVGTSLNYQLLENIPGQEGKGADLPSYVRSIISATMVLIVLSAVFMITVGGFMWLTSAGNTSRAGAAKVVIGDAIFGLILALLSYLILFVINPDLVSIRLSQLAPTAPGATFSSSGETDGTAATVSGDTASLAAQILALSAITVQTSGDCSGAQGRVSPKSNLEAVADGEGMTICSHRCGSRGSSGCTGSISPDDELLRGILTVGAQYPFTITSLGGGSHAPNSSHYRGNGVDIAPSSNWQATLDAFVRAGAKPVQGTSGSMCENSEGKSVNCTGGGADHIHISF